MRKQRKRCNGSRELAYVNQPAPVPDDVPASRTPADTYIKRPPGVIYPFWDQVNESGVGDLSRYMGPIPRSSRAMSAWASSHGQQCQPVQRNILRWRSF